MSHHMYDVWIKNSAGKWARDVTFPESYFYFGGDKVPDCAGYLESYSGRRCWLPNGDEAYHPVYREGACQFRPWLDPKWREREAVYFERGQHQPLPWDLEPITDHFAHIHYGDYNEILVRFIESERKGQEGRFTKMKPGRYVARYYPHLNNEEVRAYAVKADNGATVGFASTADDIEHVYVNGPRSCMSYNVDDFDCSIHPTRVYGNSDLQVAYLSTVAIDDERFHPSARVLVWPDRMVYGRIYGDEHRLSDKLAEMGYSHGDLDGAKIRLIREDGRIVSPYIDGALAADISDCGNYLVIASDGGVNCEVTNGYAEDGRNYCDRLGRYTNEEIEWVQDREEYWCETQRDRHAFLCSGNGNWYSNYASHEHIDGECYSHDYLRYNGTQCAETGEWFLDTDDMVFLQDRQDYVAQDWADDHAHQDPETGLWYAEEPEAAEDDSEAAKEPRCTETLEMHLETPVAVPEQAEAILEASEVLGEQTPVTDWRGRTYEPGTLGELLASVDRGHRARNAA